MNCKATLNSLTQNGQVDKSTLRLYLSYYQIAVAATTIIF